MRENAATHIWLCLEDILEELESGNIKDAIDCVEDAKEWVEPFIDLFEKAELTKPVQDYYYKHMGVNIPKHYSLAQAMAVIGELNENN